MKDASTVNDLLEHWAKRELEPDYDPGNKINAVIESNFIVQVLLYKLEKMKVDVVFPSEALCILALCADKASFIQLMAKEVLMTAVNRNGGSLPHGYVVSTSDFIDTYHGDYPIVSEQPERYKEYEDKWEQQKTYAYTFTDNMCDTYLWWRKILFKDNV